MTRIISTLGIVLLFGALAAAQQSGAPGTQQQESKPPVQPGQLAPPPTPARYPSAGSPSAGSARANAAAAAGQSQPAPPPAGAAAEFQARERDAPGDKIRTNVVIVPVTVKNRDGQLIGDLQKDEFRVFCDNVRTANCLLYLRSVSAISCRAD